MKKKDLISIEDLSKAEILKILDAASRMESFDKPVLAGKIMAVMFFEPSTRTRLSFEAAMLKLGGKVIGFTNPNATSFAKGESLEDAAKMIQNYCDIMVVRNPVSGSVKKIADNALVPVINAGDGSNEHPTQTLVDLYSIKKSQGRIDGLNIALVGDLKYGRTVHSLAKALSLFDCRLFFVSPKELAMPFSVLEKSKNYAVFEDIMQVMDKADIIYMTRIQKERFGNIDEYERLKGSYAISLDMIKNARPNMKIFHPLPRINEISKDIDSSEHAYYFEQAKSAVPVRKAILGKMLGVF